MHPPTCGRYLGEMSEEEEPQVSRPHCSTMVMPVRSLYRLTSIGESSLTPSSTLIASQTQCLDYYHCLFSIIKLKEEEQIFFFFCLKIIDKGSSMMKDWKEAKSQTYN